MSNVVFNNEPIIDLNKNQLESLKKKALEASNSRYRLCLHHSIDEQVHEMINVFHKLTYIQPHRHPIGKTESYHIIEGKLIVLIFNNDGKVIKRINMENYEAGEVFIYRITANIWHMPVPNSEFVLFHETFSGPFDKDNDVIYSDWSPNESNVESIKLFLNDCL